MSLINQMLSDLEQRQAIHVNTAATLSTPYNPTSEPNDKKSQPVFKTLLYLLVIVLLSISGYYSYSLYHQQMAALAQTSKKIQPKSVKPAKLIQKKIPTVIATQKNKPLKKSAVMAATVHLPQPSEKQTMLASSNPEPVTEENATFNNDIRAVKKQQRQPSNAQQAEIAYQKGYQLLQQNKIYSAEAKLLLALEHSAKHIKAREILTGLYIKLGRKVEAQTLLQKGLLHLPNYSNFTKLLARLFLDNNQVDKAVKVLLKHKPAMSADPDFYALLAASYQRQNNHAAAANTYVKLLKHYPRQGIWWIGMAISLEALDKKKQALEAYEKARQTGTLNTRIVNYSNQRLKILTASQEP